MSSILEIKGISKKYQNKKGEVLALENVNFRVKEGEFVSIIGPSGCGKSTLLSIISGLEKKTSGDIYIDNKKTNGVSEEIGYMLQKDCLLEWRNIWSNSVLGLEIKKKLNKKNKIKVEELLKKNGIRVNLDDREEKVGYKMREAIMSKYPYILVLGDNETQNKTITYRTSQSEEKVTLSLDEFVSKVKEEIEKKVR